MTIAPRLWLTLLATVAMFAVATTVAGRASADGEQPAFLFPWQDGQTWVTGAAGFHYSNYALDFFPPDTDASWEVHCEGEPGWVSQDSAYWILASAPGTVVYAETPYVLLDHGGGWFSRYYHLDEPQVSVGQFVAAGTRLGHPSTRGDCTTGPHVHFWVQGPNGETTKSVDLSGIPTTNLTINEPHSRTFNYDPGGSPPTPTPTPTETPVPLPTLSSVPEPSGPPTPTPEPIPGVFPSGDADCNGLLTPVDAVLILQFAAGIASSDCAATHSETNCDGTVTVADAMALLQLTLEPAAAPARTCDSPATPAPATQAPAVAPSAEPALVPTDDPAPTKTPAPTDLPS